MGQLQAFADYPLFLKALKAFRNSYPYFLELRKHPGLSHGERRLLEAKHLEKRKRYVEAALILNSVSGLPSVLEAHRQMQLAHIRDRMGLSVDLSSQRRLCEALKTLGDLPAHFTASVDLALELSQVGEQTDALTVLEELKPLRESDWQHANWQRCYALVQARQGDSKPTHQALSRLRPYTRSLKPFHARLCSNALAFCLTLAGNLEEAQAEYRHILTRFRSTDVFADRFHHLLLHAFISGETLPSTPVALRQRESFFLRYNIVRELQCGDIENSRRDWIRLQELRPDLYSDEFTLKLEYQERTAFGRCLKKYLTRDRARKPDASWEHLPPMIATLARLLGGSPTALRKTQLIEMLYHRPYEPELDGRFYRLVQMAKKAGVPIKNRSGAYFLG